LGLHLPAWGIYRGKMKFNGYLLVVVVILLIALIFIGLVTRLMELERKNRILIEENQMLKNALADFGEKIEELSTVLDILRQELDKQNDWNEEVQDGM
jgi:ABC-type bacteriocin/lantibiotic exporter with double-glycine peptidase domain